MTVDEQPPERGLEHGLAILSSLATEGLDALEALSEADARFFVERLYTSWIAGRIPPSTFGLPRGATTQLDRRIGRLFRMLPEELVSGLSFERTARSEADVRRWCWVPGWYLMSQDEDLLLMADEDVAPLLEEAGADCTKRDYAISIVCHHARDSSHHKLWDGAEGLSAHLEKVGSWAPLARAARAASAAEYLERLRSYAEPGAVTLDEVKQRIFDLRRCFPDDAKPPAIRREEDRWVVRFDRANVTEGRLFVSADDGRMWAEET